MYLATVKLGSIRGQRMTYRNYPDHRRYGTSLPVPCGTCSSTTRGRSNDYSGRRSSPNMSMLIRRTLSAVKAAVPPTRHQHLERRAWSQRHWASSTCVWIVPKNGSEYASLHGDKRQGVLSSSLLPHTGATGFKPYAISMSSLLPLRARTFRMKHRTTLFSY